MKKQFLFWGAKLLVVVAALAVGLTSCSDDDQDAGGTGGSTASELVGTWKGVVNSYGDYTELKLGSDGVAEYIDRYEDGSWEGSKYTYVVKGCEIIFTTTHYGDSDDGWEAATGDDLGGEFSMFYELKDGELILYQVSGYESDGVTEFETISDVEALYTLDYSEVYTKQ
ncbi:MAG: hypothetical protein SNH88_03535 [Rikenellaceae bacterium]